MSETLSYPKMIYHAKLEPKIVNSKEELEIWGEDWKETPAAFASSEPKVKTVDDMNEKELSEHAVAQGMSKKKIKDLSQKQILEILKGAK